MSKPTLRSLAFALATGLAACPTLRADVRLPKLFSSDMVLQQDRAVPVWGWAQPGEEVTVRLGGHEKSAVADQQGKWRVDLAAMSARRNMTLAVRGQNTVVLTNVAIGEVWVCSGQSNMAMPLKHFAIAANDRKFLWAHAQIAEGKVAVWHPSIPAPAAVRYAWATNPEGANLYNREDLPAPPFRTDNWPGVTRHRK